MSEQRNSRNINISRAHIKQNMRKPVKPSGQQPAGVHRGAQPGAGRRTAAEQRRRMPHAASGHTSASIRRRKKKKPRYVLRALVAVLVILLGTLGGLYAYAEFFLLNTGDPGKLNPGTVQTAPEYKKDITNILFLGIDTDEDDQNRADSIGSTDMILYLQMNQRDNSLHMLQIPRDTFVGLDVSTGGTGKINAVFAHGEDTKNPINNTAQIINDQFKLPVDHYVTIDMKSLRELVDIFGGLWVYNPSDMQGDPQYADANGNTSFLPQGWIKLDGASTEFFVRNRYYPQGDIQRLANQQYFYSALFRRVREMTWNDIVKLMPFVAQYINTDLSVIDCAAIAISAMKMPSENIYLCRIPVYVGMERVNGLHSVVVAEQNGIADMLNTYFRPDGVLYEAHELGLQDWAHGATATEALVKQMGAIENEETGDNVDFVPDNFSGAEAGNAKDNAPNS